MACLFRLANDTDYIENILVEPSHLTRLVGKRERLYLCVCMCVCMYVCVCVCVCMCVGDCRGVV